MTFPGFACSTCASRLDPDRVGLRCAGCGRLVPVVDGIVFFAESSPDRVAVDRFVTDAIAERRLRHDRLREVRRRRGHADPYASFRPFNESSRALEPLLGILGDAVADGAPLLDLWNRTGWTGAWLAGLFPDAPVVAIWEGDRDQLGYGGFLARFGRHDRPANLTLVFADPADPLPFLDRTFGVVHGLDTLHRYPPTLLDESMRVARDDGVLVFPHLHLTNSEPDPWFDRGCRQRHGRDWGQDLDRATEGSARRAWVLSEADLYRRRGSTTLTDERETSHYNGLALIADRRWDGTECDVPAPPVERPDARVLVNPFVDIDLTTGVVRLPVERDVVAHMSARHPVWVEELGLEPPLTARELQVVVWARGGSRIADIAAALDTTTADLAPVLERLADRRLVVVATIGESAARSQREYVDLRPEGDDFGALWHLLPIRFEDRPVLVSDDGSEFFAEDLAVLTDALGAVFADWGMTAGDRLAVLAEPHPEYLLTIWAAWLSGIVVVTLPPRAGDHLLAEALSLTEPAVVFVDEANRDRVDRVDRLVVFDPADPEAAVGPEHFSEVVHAGLDRAPNRPDVSIDRPAAVIFTSGSAGRPKGVELSMRSLMHTAAELVDHFDLRHDDVLTSLAAPHAMSGLRNPALVGLRCGATVVVPGPGARHVLGAVDLLRRHEVSVVTAGPGFVTALDAHRDRLSASSGLGSVRLILSTGAPLACGVAARVAADNDVEIGDYYGLTETGGFCAGVVPGALRPDAGLGRARGAVLDVHVDGRRADVGEVGEIRVSGPGLATRYLGSDRLARVDGWIHTGDQGVVGGDGIVRLLGRDDDLVSNRHGELISTIEIERVLRDHQAVIDCRVQPVHEVGALHAFVVVAPDADALDHGDLVTDLRTATRTRLGPAKVPDHIDIVQRLPEN